MCIRDRYEGEIPETWELPEDYAGLKDYSGLILKIGFGKKY